MTWWVILAVGAGSFVLRAAPLLVFERIPVPARAERMIRHAATAVITSIIVSSSRHAALGGADIPTLVAMIAGVVLAARQASMMRIVAAGGALYCGAAVALDLLAR